MDKLAKDKYPKTLICFLAPGNGWGEKPAIFRSLKGAMT